MAYHASAFVMRSRHVAPACVGVCMFAALLGYAWPFSVDDAYIAAQYARSLASGEGYVFRAGPPTDGVTGPLWLLPLVVAEALGASAPGVAKYLGAACASAALAAASLASARSKLGTTTSLCTTALALTSMPLCMWAVGGLETGVATLAATSLALAVGHRPRPLVRLALSSAVCLPWLRPELLPFSFVLLAGLWLREPRSGRIATCAAGASVAGVLAFRASLFGHLLPMSVAAKPASLVQGARYVAALVSRPAALSLLALIAVGLMGRVHARGRRTAPLARRSDHMRIVQATSARERVLLVALLAHVASLALAGGDWMPGARLIVPVVPSAAWLTGRLFARLYVRRATLACALLALALVLRIRELGRELPAARTAAAQLSSTRRALADALRDMRGTVVALDVGALAYASHAQVVDLGGLTEPRVAYAPGGHLNKRVDSAWLEALRPALFVLHSRERPHVDEHGRLRWFAGYAVERRVLAMPWVMRDYRVGLVIEHASDYFYVILRPARAPESR